MSGEFVQVATNSATGSSFTATLGTAPTEGSILIAAVSQQGSNTWSAGSGWTMLTEATSSDEGAIFYKVAGASEGTSQTPGTTDNTARIWTCIVAEYAGPVAATPLLGDAGNADTDSTKTSPAITPTSGVRALIVGMAFSTSSTATFSGHTIGGVAANERADVQSGSGGNANSACLFDLVVESTSGSYSTSTTVSASENGGAAIAAFEMVASGPNEGSVAGSFDFTGSATGEREPEGSATGSCDFSGTATGEAPNGGAITGSITFSGTATGSAPKGGTIAGAYDFTGTAIGSQGEGGFVLGEYDFTGSSTGQRESAGAVAGSLSFSGTATGEAPAIFIPDGTATGTYAFDIILATGQAPIIPDHEGSASGGFLFAGTAGGERDSSGQVVSGWYALTGTATGEAGEPTYRVELPTYRRMMNPPPLTRRKAVPVTETVSVVRVGGTLTLLKTPPHEQLVAAGVEGEDWFIGGHIYSVTEPLASELQALGCIVTEE